MTNSSATLLVEKADAYLATIEAENPKYNSLCAVRAKEEIHNDALNASISTGGKFLYISNHSKAF